MAQTAPRPVTFETHPNDYKHWHLKIDGAIATLSMDVREDAGLSPDYTLKLNSYDLGVDIELADAIQRLRFEHPEVHAVIVTSVKERIFCTASLNWLVGYTASTSRHSTARLPFTPSTSVLKKSARSRRTFRL